MAVAFSPDGGTLASVAGDSTVRIWDATTGAENLRIDASWMPYVWQFDTVSSENKYNSPIVANGRIFFGSRETGKVHARSAADGSFVWEFQAGPKVEAS